MPFSFFIRYLHGFLPIQRKITDARQVLTVRFWHNVIFFAMDEL